MKPLAEVKQLLNKTKKCLVTEVNLDHFEGLQIEYPDFNRDDYLEFCYKKIINDHCQEMGCSGTYEHMGFEDKEKNLFIIVSKRLK
jgi:hypothetical protein